MLYNESTGKPKAQADVFSLESLIAWLEKQPAAGEYDYGSITNCLACQYFRAMGHEVVSAGFGYTRSDWSDDGKVDHDFGQITVEHPHTFGAALDRARKVLAA